MTVERPTFVTHLECSGSGEHNKDTVQSLSRAGKPLLVQYDLAALARAVRKEDLGLRIGGQQQQHV